MFEQEWLAVLAKYTIIKEVFIICEETDPELKTNLQPLNEFRAALDHIMKLNCSYYMNNDTEEAKKQFEKLNSHLDRAFFDIADMACINYRNMICNMLEIYDREVISTAIPNYYSELRPKVDEIANRIATYRNNKGHTECNTLDLFSQYKQDVFCLKDIFAEILQHSGSLEELQNKLNKKEKSRNLPNKISIAISIIGIVVGIIIAIVF